MVVESANDVLNPGSWQSELTQRLESIRLDAGDLLLSSTSKSMVGSFLERGHIQDCVRIDQLWLDAIERGEPMDEVEARLSVEHQYILRFILAIFSGIEPGGFDETQFGPY